MTNHYFDENPTTKSAEKIFTEDFNGKKFQFIYDTSIFSKGRIDKGSSLLVKTFLDHKQNKEPKQILDLGCGYGFITVSLAIFLKQAQLTCVDINRRAVLLCEKNCKMNKVNSNCYPSDGFENVSQSFDAILFNPPIRIGKEAVYNMLTDSINYLNPDGQLWVVVRVKQGAKSMKSHLQNHFAIVETVQKKGGYHIIKCVK